MACGHCARPLFFFEQARGYCTICVDSAQRRIGRLFELSSAGVAHRVHRAGIAFTRRLVRLA